MFRAPAMLLPHESTVAHEQRFIMDAPMISRTRSRPFGEGSLSLQEQPDLLPEQINLEDLAKLQVSLPLNSVRILTPQCSL